MASSHRRPWPSCSRSTAARSTVPRAVGDAGPRTTVRTSATPHHRPSSTGYKRTAPHQRRRAGATAVHTTNSTRSHRRRGVPAPRRPRRRRDRRPAVACRRAGPCRRRHNSHRRHSSRSSRLLRPPSRPSRPSSRSPTAGAAVRVLGRGNSPHSRCRCHLRSRGHPRPARTTAPIRRQRARPWAPADTRCRSRSRSRRRPACVAGHCADPPGHRPCRNRIPSSSRRSRPTRRRHSPDSPHSSRAHRNTTSPPQGWPVGGSGGTSRRWTTPRSASCRR